MRQSILKMAFCAQLVPQDTYDEPASIFLERIREEHAPETQVKLAKKKSATRKKCG